MMLTGGIEAAEGKSQCSPGLMGWAGGADAATGATGAAGAADGACDTAGAFAGAAFQPAA